MATAISITTSRDLQVKAASLLSQYLDNHFHCPHAFIGGFAWSLLGSQRPTEINVLIETHDLDIHELRKELENLDERFASAGMKFFYVQDRVKDLKGEARVHASKNNVLIETLKTGTLGLPTAAGPVYRVEHPSGVSIPILSPPILLLTKITRWYHTHESTRPKTVSKNQADKDDLDFLIFWLSANDQKIDFDLYKGKEKSRLLNVVQTFHDKFREDNLLMEALQDVLYEEDWEAIHLDSTKASALEREG